MNAAALSTHASARTCPSWCVNDDDTCRDHWSSPGGATWPGIRATAWPQKGVPTLTAHPTWGEADHLAPAVALWVNCNDVWEIDETIDMTPEEAIEVAGRLIAAAEAAMSARVVR